jgi:hypothetical protein
MAQLDMEDRAMEQLEMPAIDLDPREDEELRLHDWRAEQLRVLGLPRMLADRFADRVDWHDVAALVDRGCTPRLALEIVR